MKGATGAGAPLLAVPLLAMLFDVKFAVAVFLLPNLIPNLWQAWHFRKVDVPRSFVLKFAVLGGVGAVFGTYALASFPSDVLIAGIAGILLLYISFRLLNSGWKLQMNIAEKLSAPMGLVAGLFQGGTGLSAPVSISFLNALQLERPQFIFTISTFFFSVGLVQLPLQIAFGIMTWDRLALSALALIPLLAAMPVGMALGRVMSRKAFDRLLLIILAGLAMRMLYATAVAL